MGRHRTLVPDGRALPSRRADRDPAPLPRLVSAALIGAGRALVGLGVLLLAFAGFQLWGTGVVEAQAQDDLRTRFETLRTSRSGPGEIGEPATPALGQAGIRPASSPTPQDADDGPHAVPATLPRSDRAVAAAEAAARRPVPSQAGSAGSEGDPIATLDIPAIGVTKTVVKGTTRDSLRAGPGHYASTPLPGRPGNAAIAGHRTTHGAPFFDLDRLQPGDEIRIGTLEGEFVYLVEGHDDGTGAPVGHRIVDPGQVDVIGDHGDNRLTLTACHPKYSARERIVVTATLVGDPVVPGAAGPWVPPDPLDPHAAVVPTALVHGSGTARGVVAPADAASEPHGTMAAGRAVAASPSVGPSGPDLPGADDTAGSSRPGDTTDNTADDPVTESLGWQPHLAGPTLGWAGATALIVAGGALLGRMWRRPPAYAMALPPFGLALFHFFTNLERLLPAV